jgi:hypothetical protein
LRSSRLSSNRVGARVVERNGRGLERERRHREKERKREEEGKGSAGLDTKDCLFARDNQIWLSGKKISLQTCPPGNQIFCFLLIFTTLDK